MDIWKEKGPDAQWSVAKAQGADTLNCSHCVFLLATPGEALSYHIVYESVN